MADDNAAAKAIGGRIRERRKERRISLDTMFAEVYRRLPSSTTRASTETLRRIEDGTRLPDPLVLAAIADLLGVSVMDLAPEMYEDYEGVRDLMERAVTMSRCFTVSPGQGSFWPSLVAA